MNEDYRGLAGELLQINMSMLQVPARRQLAKLTQGERFVLNYLLTHHQHAHPGELSRGLVVSTARIAALLSRMEEKDYILREPDPTDNRQVIVTLLPDGLQAIEAIRAQVVETIEGMLERLGPEDAREYVRIQRKILANIVSPEGDGAEGSF